MVKEEGKNSSMVELAKSVLSAMNIILNKKTESVVSIAPDKDGWKLIIEALERKAMPDSMDLVGRYEVKTDQSGEIHNFNQILLRRRSDTTALET